MITIIVISMTLLTTLDSFSDNYYMDLDDKTLLILIDIIEEEERRVFNDNIDGKFHDIRYEIGQAIWSSKITRKYELYLEVTNAIVANLDERRIINIDDNRIKALMYYLENNNNKILMNYTDELIKIIKDMIDSEFELIEICDCLIKMNQIGLKKDYLEMLCNKMLVKMVSNRSIEHLIKDFKSSDNLASVVALSGGTDAGWVRELIGICRSKIVVDDKEESCKACKLSETLLKEVFGSNSESVIIKMVDDKSISAMIITEKLNTMREGWKELNYDYYKLYGIHDGYRLTSDIGKTLIPEIDGLVIAIGDNEENRIYIPCKYFKSGGKVKCPTHLPKYVDAVIYGKDLVMAFDRETFKNVVIDKDSVGLDDKKSVINEECEISGNIFNNINSVIRQFRLEKEHPYFKYNYSLHPCNELYSEGKLIEDLRGVMPIDILYECDQENETIMFKVRSWMKLEEQRT